jgi:hypothetical protein
VSAHEPTWTFDWALDESDGARSAAEQKALIEPFLEEAAWVKSYKPWIDVEAGEVEAEGKYDPDADNSGSYTTVCIWCGMQCDTSEKLEAHEDECAP